MKIRKRKGGLPKRLKWVDGLLKEYDVTILEGHPKAKVLVFRSRQSMRTFYKKILPELMGHDGELDSLGYDCEACVSKMELYHERYTSVDKNYFCIALFCASALGLEVVAHEAGHVGFAWDFRTHGVSQFSDPDNSEENICYVIGRFTHRLGVRLSDDQLL